MNMAKGSTSPIPGVLAEGKSRDRAAAASRVLLIFGSGIIFFLFVTILFVSMGFLFDFSITLHHFYFSILSLLGFIIAAYFLIPFRHRLMVFLLLAGLWIGSFYLSLEVSKSFFDLSYDGQAYHQEALIQLVRGWNPVYHQLSGPEANNMDRWLNHYSKGVWFYESVTFQVTQNIEAAKLFHFWLMMAAFSITLSFLLEIKGLPIWLAFLISLLAAFNPVSIYQSLSFYLDGQLMSLVVILIVSLGLIGKSKESNRFHFFLLFMTIAVLLNMKLTAGIYVTILIAGYLAILWFNKKVEILQEVFSVFIGSFLLAFIIFGFSPYVTNTLSQGNPLYPALGTDRSDYTAPQFPANFTGRNPAFLLFYSIFSKSDNVRGPDKTAVLKLPFTVSGEELKAFTDTNAKQGGFGPLFGGAVMLAVIVFAAALISLYRLRGKPLRGNDYPDLESLEANPKTNISIGLFCSAIVLATCLVNPASSLARFIPHMWLLPIFAFFLAYFSKNQLIRVVGYAIIVTLLLNNALVAFAYYKYNFEITGVYRQRLEKMVQESKVNPFKFYFGHFRTSNVWRFDHLGINFEVTEHKDECKNGQRILPNSIVLKCTSD
ncbi:MAG: hypothetical protein H6Q42_1712 [Deltaproteobacteria bacterium]|nr:hypothetical protein [Deltaproteobacteria bacterium]